MKSREQIISNAVINGLTVQGDFGANNYNVCDLLGLSLTSLNNIYSKLNDLAEKSKSKSLFDRTSVNEILAQKIELVETVFQIKKEQQDAAELRKEQLKAKQDKLAVLKAAKEQKEIEAINNLTLEELDRQIAELS